LSRPISHTRLVNLTYSALGAVLIVLCSWITVPGVVPFTLQTFAVFAVLSLLGGKRGLVSILVYLALGAVGIPVFSGFSAGIGYLLGSTGGYLVGFILIALSDMLFIRLFGRKKKVEALALFLGLLGCYAFGTLWFMTVYARSSGAIGLGTALSWCVLPFVLPDLCKLAAALLLSQRLIPILKLDRKQ